MKSIQIEDDLYHFIASQTQDIGESASDILRRLVMPESVFIKPDRIEVSEEPSSSLTQKKAPLLATERTAESVCMAGAVFDELAGQQLQAIPKIVERWLLVLSIIHKHHMSQFSKVLGMSGRNRTYFAIDKETLLTTGSSTNPKNVPGSDYWVITNNNTVKKINMLKEVAEEMGFNQAQIEKLIGVFTPEHIS